MVLKISNDATQFQRGAVYWVAEHSAQGSEQKKTRPWVLVGATPINKARSTVIAVPLSTQVLARPPLSVAVYLNNTNVCAVIDQVRALDKKRFIRYEGRLLAQDISAIDDGLRQVLAL